MIFSDLYVRFYNEAFKFVDAQGAGELEKFFAAIAENVFPRVGDLFMKKGLDGMEEYWGTIRKEENCASASRIEDGVRISSESKCPSLSKVLNSDAAPCPKYCLHCPGWVLPVMTRCGFYCVFDVIGVDVPECGSFQTESREKAENIVRQLAAAGRDPKLIFTNLDQAEEVERNQRRRKSAISGQA